MEVIEPEITHVKAVASCVLFVPYYVLKQDFMIIFYWRTSGFDSYFVVQILMLFINKTLEIWHWQRMGMKEELKGKK